MKVLDNIDTALVRVTQNNPNLLIAYYDHYAEHELTDKHDDSAPAGTENGDTDVNPHVLTLDSRFPDGGDAMSFLGETLMHEFVHTPQGGAADPIERALRDAKAYPIEKFLAERIGDQQRADFISNRSLNDSVDKALHADEIFRKNYNTIEALYKVIDSGRTQAEAQIAGDVSADEARRLSVELISKNEDDYSPRLKEFISKLHH